MSRSVEIMRTLLKLGSLFTVLWLLAASTEAQQSNFKRITIDGSFSDWAGIPPALDATDPQERTDSIDYKEIYLAHDQNYIYVRFSLYTPGDPFTSRNNIFIDADNNSRTGFGGGRGSELLIQSGVGYQEKNGRFNEGGIQGLDWQAAGSPDQLEYEFRISRSAVYAADGLPVFDSQMIAILLEAESPNFSPVEYAPDFGTVAYDLSATPPPFTGAALDVITLGGGLWSFTDAGTEPVASWKDASFDPSVQPGWASGPALLGYSGNPAAYPISIATPLSRQARTVYLRTTFEWDYDSKGIVLISTNHISDGAVFYLNGLEAKRLRMPDGAITSSTYASGSNPSPGSPEVLVLPSSALTLGENVLAVEVHQTEGDNTDLVFGLALVATGTTPVLITNPNEPADREVIEGEPTVFKVEVTGTDPITYQWFKGTTPILGANSATYSISQVLQSDAGEYHVEMSNPLTTKLSSRTAILTTKAFPARINNKSLPADVTTLEGRSVSFEVDAAGSAPLTFQWYKNGAPIPDATNTIYSIASTLVSDSGEYYVVVGNRLPDTATSRTAILKVTGDQIPPKLISASGSGTQIVLAFDEPVDVASATLASNYSVDQGVAVLSASMNAGSDSLVTLTTGPQTLGTVYTLSISGVKDLFGNPIAPNTTTKFRSTIRVDGSFSDWTGIAPIAVDDQEDVDGPDWKELYITNDDDYIYLRITFHNVAFWPTSFFYINFFFDADNKPATGYQPFGSGIGSELLVQGGNGYQEKAGLFNAGGIDGLGWQIAPEGAGSDFEIRISRHAVNTADGTPVFRAGGFGISLESENISYVTVDRSPNSGSIRYSFQPEILDPVSFKVVDGQLELSWSGDGILQSRESLTSGDWTDEGDQSNPQTVDPSNGTRYYRLFKP